MPVGPPAGRPPVASADTGPSTQGPAPAKETTRAAQAAGAAAPPLEGAPGAQGAETTAPASRAAAPTAALGAPPARGVAPAQDPDASPGAAQAAEGGRESAQGVEIAALASRATVPAGHAAAPGTPWTRGTDPVRAPGAAVGKEGPKYRAHANQTHTHTRPRKAGPPEALPHGADAARPPPGARAFAAGRHAAAGAEAAGRPARDPGGGGRHADGAGCQRRERGAGDRRRQGECPGTHIGGGPGHTRQGARAQRRARRRGQRQRRGTECWQRTARRGAGSWEGPVALGGRAGARARRQSGCPRSAWSGAMSGGRAWAQPRA